MKSTFSLGDVMFMWCLFVFHLATWLSWTVWYSKICHFWKNADPMLTNITSIIYLERKGSLIPSGWIVCGV